MTNSNMTPRQADETFARIVARYEAFRPTMAGIVPDTSRNRQRATGHSTTRKNIR